MCGEHVGDFLNEFLTSGSSPHVRGAPEADVRGVRPAGIIPACAGSTERHRDSTPYVRDHPRMCGEHTSKIA